MQECHVEAGFMLPVCCNTQANIDGYHCWLSVLARVLQEPTATDAKFLAFI